MESFPLFFRIRAITFTLMMLLSFLWLVLLCVEIFARWTMADQTSHSLMILFILTNTITLIMLPVLILVQFRAWLDAARLLLLFVLQAGSAAAGTYWSPKIRCPDQTPDDIGVCQLIAVYTLIACWIIPAILLLYSTYFSVVVYLQSRIPVVVESARCSSDDPEVAPVGSPAPWKVMLKEIVGVQTPIAETSTHPQPLVLPTMVHAGPSSLPQPLASQPQSALPNAPRRQLTMPSSSQAGSQYPLLPHSLPSRHHSLPAFKHGNEPPYIRPVLTLPISHPVSVTAKPPLLPQTPSSYSCSSPSSSKPESRSFNFGPDSNPDVQFPNDRRWCSRHLSMIPSSSPPREMPATEESPTTPRSKRARLSKPLPAHFM